MRGAGRKERKGWPGERRGAAGSPAGESEQEEQKFDEEEKGLEISLGVERASNGTAPRETDGEADAS